MNTPHLYEVNLKWNRERKGTLSSPVLPESIAVATPPEFPKGMKDIWSPEHLFVSSVSSCLMTTFLAIAEASRLHFTDLDIQAEGKLEKVDGKYMMSEIILKPVLKISSADQKDKAERILQKSEAACLISNSILTEVKMEIKIIAEDEEVTA